MYKPTLLERRGVLWLRGCSARLRRGRRAQALLPAHAFTCEDARARGLHSSGPAPANSIACADKANPARTTRTCPPLAATRRTWHGPRPVRQPRIVCSEFAAASSFITRRVVSCRVVRSPATRSATMTEPSKNSSVAPARRPTFARSEPIDLTSGASRLD